MTIIEVSICYTDDVSLTACFPMTNHLNVQTNDPIACIDIGDFSLEECGNDPINTIPDYFYEMGLHPLNTCDDSLITAEKIITIWKYGRPVRLIRSGIYYEQPEDQHRIILNPDQEPSLENAWYLVKHLEVRFRTAVFVGVPYGFEGGPDNYQLAKPEWFVPIIDCKIVENPILEALKSL